MKDATRQRMYELHCQWESRRMFRKQLEDDKEGQLALFQRDPDYYLELFGSDFERSGFNRDQVERFLRDKSPVEPS